MNDKDIYITKLHGAKIKDAELVWAQGVETLTANKQNKLIAGDGIKIEDDVISTTSDSASYAISLANQNEITELKALLDDLTKRVAALEKSE